MPVDPSSSVQTYLDAFNLFEQNGGTHDPSWVRQLRSDAIYRFKDLGFPTARKGNEEWKYTDTGPLARTPFMISTEHTPITVTDDALTQIYCGQSDWNQLVFLDGIYNEKLSSLGSLPVGVTVQSLTNSLKPWEHLLKPHLATHVPYEHNSFAALNTAFIHDGAFVHIPDNITVEKPILLTFLSTCLAQHSVTQPRVIVLAGKNSKVSLIENYQSLFKNSCFTNSVTEIVMEDDCTVEYYKYQNQNPDTYHITNTQITQGRNSMFSSVNVDLGGGMVRNNLNLLMAAEGSSCNLNGLYMLTGTQHVDNQVIIDHAQPYTSSRELYKGILDGRSRSVFHGSIIVREGAQKVDARQEDKNLLLSSQAEADTKPAFWIYCDDVKCSHGAACGQIDEEALFYLRSRCINEQDARALLVRAFIVEVIDSIKNESFRAHIDNVVQNKLDQWLGY